MKLKNWNKKLPALVLTNKLAEEAIEVGTEITDAWMKDREPDVIRINDELDQVEHLVRVLRKKFPIDKRA